MLIMSEVYFVEERIVSCDGGGGALGHPRIYLSLEGESEVECPYCGRRYVLATERYSLNT